MLSFDSGVKLGSSLRLIPTHTYTHAHRVLIQVFL